MSDVINVGLYGGKGLFGGKETPLEASVIYCDKYETCSYYQNNQCLNVRAPFSSGCKFGSVSDIKGYTSRASKYGEFRSKWRNHEKYSKLNYPSSKLGLIGDLVVFPYPYLRIKKLENGSLAIENPSIGSSIAYIDFNQFTAEFINKLCVFRPQAMFGGTITDYQAKIVPLFLTHLKEVLPQRYEELKGLNANIDSRIDYVGRKALIKTINPSHVTYNSRSYPQFNEKWYWDGEILKYIEGYTKDFNVTKDYEIAEIKIKPSDKSIVTISSNEQVSEKTVFID